MAAANSPATGEAYGVRRVCAAWGMPRSSFYAARTVSEAPTPGRRRGPRPVVDDAGRLEATRHDLDRSPFSGEGHRTVWARLRALDGLRVGRDRVLPLMRENALLSPHPGPQRPVNDHGGRITTDAPGVMWGTDAAVIPTVEDGNIALFVVVEHWNAEALGTSPKRPTASPPPRLSISPSTPPAGRCGPTPPAAFCSATTTAAPLCPPPSRPRSPSSA